jgi:hypothetical protein
MYVLNYIDRWSFLLITRLMHDVSRHLTKGIVSHVVYYYGVIVFVMLQSCYVAAFQKKAILKGLSKPLQVTMSKKFVCCKKCLQNSRHVYSIFCILCQV